MFPRAIAFAVLVAAPASAQVAFNSALSHRHEPNATAAAAQSAWLDLRQHAAANRAPQNAPRWVESITLVPAQAQADVAGQTTFRIRVTRPHPSLHLLLLRLFFDDKPEQRPEVTVWDESGTQVLSSGPLGAGIDLPSSDTVALPMIGVSCIDISVPGDGANVRGIYMDWMTSRHVAHPLSAEPRDVMPAPFSAAGPLRVPEQDAETFGTVTAALAPEVIRIGASVQAGAAFQFEIESAPLLALVSFEVSTARIDAPPEIFVNGENLGPVSLTLPDMADPAYRGEAERLAPMKFHYTGWLRAQKLVPAASLRTGTNDVIVIGGPGTPASAIRATQIQLKYLWDKSDYLLAPK